MRKTVSVVTLVSLLLLATGAAGESMLGLPVHIQRLDPAAVRVWVGDTISSTATVAVATDDGVVVFDTTGNPKVDRELRRVIARELGRSDFKYLINTHEHGDHTGGNVVYADCTIVGHERVAAGMATRAEDRARFAEWGKTRIAELEHQLAEPPADQAAVAKLREELVLARLNLETLESAQDLHPPTKTITDRMTLRVGDTVFELYDVSGMHSASDIAIFVPDHGLLLTGDTMADTWLTDTPGCLASFMARPGVPHDFPRLLANWDLLVAKRDEIRRFLPGHWNGELSFAGFEARVNYVRALWDGVNRGVEASRNLAELTAEYDLNTRFPALVGSPGFNRQNNATTILEMWIVATGQESAARRLHALIDEGADESAIRQVLAERGADRAKYFFLEPEINLSGYHFLQENKVAQALALFRINVELFPDSWNVYDSLGEALLVSGDTAGARAMYEKSLALNPESQSGKAALLRIRGEAASQ